MCFIVPAERLPCSYNAAHSPTHPALLFSGCVHVCCGATTTLLLSFSVCERLLLPDFNTCHWDVGYGQLVVIVDDDDVDDEMLNFSGVGLSCFNYRISRYRLWMDDAVSIQVCCSTRFPVSVESPSFLYSIFFFFFSFFLGLKCNVLLFRIALLRESLPALISILHMDTIRGVPACFPTLFMPFALSPLKPTLVSVTHPLIPEKTASIKGSSPCWPCFQLLTEEKPH